MRHMQCNAPAPLRVPAAHSRIIAPGEVVDFDDVVKAAEGAPYSLETALGSDASLFSPAPAPIEEAVAESTEPEAPVADAPEGRGRGRRSR